MDTSQPSEVIDMSADGEIALQLVVRSPEQS